MNFKKVIAPIIVAGVVVATSILGFSGVLKQKNTNTNYSKWMANLDDNTSLREVDMPGSHDTMATISIGNLAGQCQSLSLADQLTLGVRFLDIRLKQEKSNLEAVHGFIDQKVKFDEIVKVVDDFLNNNPSEFIIMSIKEEADPSKPVGTFEECVKSKLSNKYILDRTIPENVGSVRGKVVLLSRYKNSSIGIEAYSEWKDSTSFTMASSDIYIQDEYKIKSGQQKIDAVTSCFNENGHALKINFLSAYRTNYIPPSYAPSAALDINPWINNNIKNFDDRNIVLYDFVNEVNMKAFFEGMF